MYKKIERASNFNGLEKHTASSDDITACNHRLTYVGVGSFDSRNESKRVLLRILKLFSISAVYQYKLVIESMEVPR